MVAAERAAELDRAETEFVTKVVGGLGELFQLFAPLGLEKIKLFAAVAKAGESDPEQADPALGIPVAAKEFQKNGKDVSVELRGLGQCFGTGIRVESGGW